MEVGTANSVPWIERFLPNELHVDERPRARLQLWFALIGSCSTVGIFLFSLVLLQGVRVASLAVLFSSILFLMVLFLPRWTGSMRPGFINLALLPAGLPLVVSAVAYGPRTPVLFAFFALPTIGILIGGARLGGWYVAAGVIGMTALALAEQQGVLFRLDVTDAKYTILYPVVFSVTLVSAGNSATAYERTLRRALDKAHAALHELRIARREAEAANLAKSRFLANMSHELRTPLNGILGYCELIKEELDEQQVEGTQDLDRIHQAGSHLLAIIGDLLDLAKVEAGEMQVARTRFEVRRVLDEVIGVTRAACAQHGNQLEVQISPGIGQMDGDERRVAQILLNLLSNACKFTDQGVIHLRARRETREVDWVVFEVQDDGRGINPTDLPRLFQPFSQVHGESPGTFGGTGLGLALTRRLAHLMGGEVTVTSEIDVGSCFSVELPVSTPQPD